METPKMQLHDWLDDLCVRFVVNLPEEELESVERICFQIEEAQWFYEDFIRPLDPLLPSLNLRQFCLLMFKHCPLFFGYDQDTFVAAYAQFLDYKIRVPVRGAILLNDTMDHVLLVKGWKKGANWSFPRGKINKDEPDLDCAIREVREETGYDVYAAGLVRDGTDTKALEITMKGQHMKLYVFPDVPMNTVFQPQTRKEISKIQWWKLSTLPGWTKNKQPVGGQESLSANKLYMVAPFLGPLRKWITKQKRPKSKSLGQVNDVEWNTEGQVSADAGYPSEGWQPQQDQARQLPLQRTDNMADMLQQAHTQQVRPIQPPQAASSDPSDHLKRLLSVGAPIGAHLQDGLQVQQRPPPASASSNAASLLALLKSGGNTPAQTNPRTPFDQMMTQKMVPDSPQRAPQRQAELSTQAPPPSFPLAPNQPLAQQPQQYAQSTLPTQRQKLLDLFQNKQAAGSVGETQAGRALANQLSHPKTGAIEHQGRDLHAPAASQLPKPTLSTHAQSLLAALRSEAPLPVPKAASTQSTAPHELPAARVNDILPQLQQWQPGHNYSRTRDHLPKPFVDSPPSQPAGPPQALQPKLVVATPPIAQPSAVNPETHQSSLLKLFQSPPPPSQPAVVPPIEAPSRLAPDPVELSAIASPRPPTLRQPITVQNTPVIHALPVEAKKPETESSRQSSKVNSIVPSKTTKPKPAKPTEKTSPALKAQTDAEAPATPPVRRGKAVSTGRTLWQPNDPPSSSKQQPVQILKRPGSSRGDKNGAAATQQQRSQKSQISSTTSSPRAFVTKDPASKPFQPTILKRPDQSPAVEPSDSSLNALGLVTNPSPKPIGPTNEHRQNLLSLFGESQKPSPISNPASPPGDIALRNESGLPPKELFTALTSPGPEVATGSSPAPPQDASRSRMNSIINASRRASSSSQRDRTASSTPMSPQDKGFLLNYLDQVVKKAGR